MLRHDTAHDASHAFFIGIMSGTSLDGVDAVLAEFADAGPHLLAHASLPFPDDLREQLLALNTAGESEIERGQLAGNALTRLYAECVYKLLKTSGLSASAICAIGSHGQTVRHRPDLGFTVQIGNPALLAELSGICVVADFRSRDIAAGGQGAPLVAGFHQAVFGDAEKHRVIVNIGGISNLSDLPADGVVSGFDCGPGNLLMDGWTQRHLNQPFDKDGAWAASGTVIPQLLATLHAHPFFAMKPPRSTGRDDFNLPWLERHTPPSADAANVQATLLELSALAIAEAVDQYCANATEVYLCGGGAYNTSLFTRLKQLLGHRHLGRTNDLGVPATEVEAAAFAWLARQTLLGMPGNLPAVTGASGSRILGAIYPS